MILFVFEGKEREPQLYHALERLFFPKETDSIVCSFGNNIYELYRQITRLGEGADIVSVLRERRIDAAKRNWQHLKDMNVCKANYICRGENVYPRQKSDIAQQKIFEAQLKKYVGTEDCSVAVLNAFPIFLYDYFV